MNNLMKLLGLGLLLVAGPVLGQTVEYIHTDALGSPVAMTDASGNVVERSLYEPYGAPIARSQTDNPGFAGHVEDSSTGLTYMQQRYYDPQVGGFLSVDPVTGYSNPSEASSRYRYANGSPYTFMDPDGRRACGKDTTCQLEQGDRGGVTQVNSLDSTASDEGKKDSGNVQGATATEVAAVGGAVPAAGAEGAGLTGLAAYIRLLLGRSIIAAPLVIGGDSRVPQFVVRGGMCTSANFCGGSGVTIDSDGNLQGVSVQSFRGISVQGLSQRQWVPNNQVGVTTVEQVRALGGDVIPAPTYKNPYHAVMSGITPAQAETLFTPTIPNPNPKP